MVAARRGSSRDWEAQGSTMTAVSSRRFAAQWSWAGERWLAGVTAAGGGLAGVCAFAPWHKHTIKCSQPSYNPPNQPFLLLRESGPHAALLFFMALDPQPSGSCTPPLEMTTELVTMRFCDWVRAYGRGENRTAHRCYTMRSGTEAPAFGVADTST